MSGQQCLTCECLEDSCESCKYPADCANCNSCCCTPAHIAGRKKQIHQGLLLEYFTIGWMLVEVAGSLIAGFIASSYALIAFGSDSVVELASAFVVLRHLRLDIMRSEALGERTSFFASLLLIALIPVIGISSTYSFFILKIQPQPSILGLAIAIGAVSIMPLLWIKKRDIGRKTACLPLTIDAAESAACFFMSTALLASLLIEYVLRIGWTDYAATLVILGFVALEAKESLEEARGMNQSLISSSA
jgi:divalent metal cation (Fe/Co/Zn/Cd) transporter